MQLGGKKIVLLNVGGKIRAFEDRCPHLGFQLSAGDARRVHADLREPPVGVRRADRQGHQSGC